MSENNKKPIYVTEPYLPPLDEFTPYLEQIWENKRVTNKGPFHDQLEEELCSFLGVKHISLFCNGTIALLVAMKALRLTGEIITTPYTFVATTHAIKWNGLTPVFVDIEEHSCNIDPGKIENAITDKTTGIMPVHVYGVPCNIEEIQNIADKYDLKVIYDAAHAFGVKENGSSILNAGDLSVLSFHGTKVFNTFEGGAIVSQSKKMKRRIDDLKNFSFHDELSVTGLGINGKMNEVQAAIGLLQLKYIKHAFKARNKVHKFFRSRLKDIPGLRFQDIPSGVDYNFSYFPVFINEEKFGISRDGLFDLLIQRGINARRYFYPIVSEFPIYRGLNSSKPSNLINSHLIARQVICLPIYPELSHDMVKRIVSIIRHKK